MLAGGGLAVAVAGMEWLRFRHSAAESDSLQGGRRIGGIPFDDEGRAPLDTPVGDELDGRLYTDLSRGAASERRAVKTPLPTRA